MRVTLVGGVERNAQLLEGIASKLGHKLDFHGGHLTGRGVDDMHRMVDRADLVVVATNVNSHGAAQLARKLANKRGVPFVMTTSCNPTRFRELLVERGEAGAR